MGKVDFTVLVLAALLTLSGLNMVGRFGETVQAYPGPAAEWIQYYGSYDTNDCANSVAQTSDGGYVLAGYIYGWPVWPYGYDALLVRTDSNGNKLWNMSYGASGYDVACAVVQTSDGGFVFAGHSSSYSSSGDYDFWLVKTSSAGNMVWSKTYAGTNIASNHDECYCMIQTSDGGFLLGGRAGWKALGLAWLVKTDSTGNKVWDKTYSETGAYGAAFSIVQTSDGGYAFVGNGYFVKTNSIGNVQWVKTPGAVYSLVKTSDGGYALLGITAPSPGDECFTLYKTDSNGNPVWESVPGPSGESEAKSLVQTSDGGYALAGITYDLGTTPLNGDGYLVKTDKDGVHEWWNYYGGVPFQDEIDCVIKTSDGGLALTGMVNHDVILVKLAATYSVTIWGWDYIGGWWVPVPITMDGAPTGHSTPWTFTGLTGTHTFTVPSVNSEGHPFSDWDTGWTDPTITVSSGGTYTARYREGYSVTIWSWCASEPQGWMSVPITMDGAPTGHNTGWTFTGLTGTHTFTVPTTDALDHTFYEWNTGWPHQTITVSSSGVYTARYRQATAVLAVRGLDNRIYYRILSGGSWDSWNVVPVGATCDSPAAAVLGNSLFMVVRGMDGNSLWYSSIDLASKIFSGWKPLSGATPSAPTLTSNGTALCLVVRGLDNRIYLRCYTSGSWGSWHALSKGATCDSPAAALVGDSLNLFVRGMDGNSLWYVMVTCDGQFLTAWTQNPGATPSKPTVGKVPTMWGTILCLTVRGLDNKVYLQAGVPWVALPGATIDAPAATGSCDNTPHGRLHIVVRGMDGNTLWYGYYTTYYSTFSGWTLLSGATNSAPTLAS